MKLLKGIGALFVKLWRWIKETAWVQPLLIVGAIFAIIFSIPYFTKWVDSLSTSTSNAYYSQFQISLNKQSATDKSAADKCFDGLNTYSYLQTDEIPSYEQVTTEQGFIDFKNTYGEKFFLVFVSKECGDCKNFQPALELLQKEWGNQYRDCFDDDDNDETKGCPIKIHTVFADEISDIDDDDDNEYNQKTVFERFLYDHADFFENSQVRFSEETITPYTKNASVSQSKFDSYSPLTPDADFPVPTILLVDFTEAAFEHNRPGASEILFGVSGTTEYEKANLLTDMWNHFDTRISTSITNKFSANYDKK